MQILVTELQPNQMGAFYLMRLGIEIPDSITKNDLVHIICYLCDKLCWIEEEDSFMLLLRSRKCIVSSLPLRYTQGPTNVGS